jgi:hypothetical protein
MHYAGNLTRLTRLRVTSHSHPLINTKYKIQVTKYLLIITNEPIKLIVLITSWLTINITTFPF